MMKRTIAARGVRRCGHRRTGGLGAVALLLAVTLVIPPGAAYGAPADGSAPVAQAERDRLATEFAAVLSLREAPDSMCLSVMLDGDPIVESRSGTAFTPASLMKVATAAAAFEVMSPDEVFTTEVFARTEDLESINDGVLAGDVYLVGQGDPVLSTPRYVNRYAEPVAHTDITGLANQVMDALSAHGHQADRGPGGGGRVLVSRQGTRLLGGGRGRRDGTGVETLLRDRQPFRTAVGPAPQQRVLAILQFGILRGPPPERASGPARPARRCRCSTTSSRRGGW